MQFVDLEKQQIKIIEQINQNIKSVLNHGKYIMGPEVKSLENRLKAYVNAKHAIACSSGTDALLLALLANGVGPHDAIFTTPFTFIATAEAISLIGATPVFVDIDATTYNIDPEKLDLAIANLQEKDKSLTPKGIIAVDLFGLPADYDEIDAIADKYGLFVIEDAAQSFGGEYHGKKTCTFGSVACTSFFPAKPLGCYGDGGMCFTDDDNIAEKIRSLTVHGKGAFKYDNVRIGINGRLDTLQAAILHAKFEIFPDEIELRQKIAAGYTELFSNSNALLTVPLIPEGYKSAWAQYSLLAESDKHRSNLQNKLKSEGIPTAIYYPTPLHLQSAFKSLGYREGDFPISEDCSRRIFSLPMHPYLSREEQNMIKAAIEV